MNDRARVWGLALACLGPLLLAGCQRSGKDSAGQDPPKAEAPPEVPFKLSVDEKGLLYTFVEQDGSFHLAEKLAEIPEGSRSQVRVVLDGKSPGTQDHVYVADLRRVSPGDAVTPVALSRDAWEAHGLKFRQAKVTPLEEQPAPTSKTALPKGVDAIIYGADWCGPCHQAEAYLKKKGLSVIKKNIEKDAAAAAEMRAKLSQAGLGGSSIPILDVGGTILVGFSPRAIEAALKRSKAPR